MLVLIDAKPVTDKKTVRKMQRLTKRKITNRQDSIDDEDMKVGPNRGNEAVFNK
jgi:hypothetical protein